MLLLLLLGVFDESWHLPRLLLWWSSILNRSKKSHRLASLGHKTKIFKTSYNIALPPQSNNFENMATFKITAINWPNWVVQQQFSKLLTEFLFVSRIAKGTFTCVASRGRSLWQWSQRNETLPGIWSVDSQRCFERIIWNENVGIPNSPWDSISAVELDSQRCIKRKIRNENVGIAPLEWEEALLEFFGCWCQDRLLEIMIDNDFHTFILVFLVQSVDDVYGGKTDFILNKGAILMRAM